MTLPPLPPFQDLLNEPEFQQAPPERQAELSSKYWDRYESENPDDPWAKQQRELSKVAFESKQRVADAAPIEKRIIGLNQEEADFFMRVSNADKEGAWESQEQRDALVKPREEEFKQRREQAKRTASLFADKEIVEAMQPTWESLDRFAKEGGVFGPQQIRVSTKDGSPLAEDADVVSKRSRFDALAQRVSDDFNIPKEDIIDIAKHRADAYEKPISRDALGQVHVKRDLLAKGNQEVQQAIMESDLPDSEKSKLRLESAFRVGEFRKNVLETVKRDHPALSKRIKWTADLEKDYQQLEGLLNEGVLEQGASGAASPLLGRAGTVVKGALQSQVTMSPTGMNVTGPLVRPLSDEEIESTSAYRATGEQSEYLSSINQLSNQINQEKVRFLGTDAAAIGQGLYSVGESVALMATPLGSVGNKLISAERIKKAGKAGQLLLGAGQRAANTAGVAAIYGTEQGMDVLERTGRWDLAFKAFAAEAIPTMLFSAVKLEGIEGAGQKLGQSMLQALGRSEVRERVGKSVAQAWGKVITGVGKTAVGEIPEEALISWLNDTYVESQINPEMTVEDRFNNLKDTIKITGLTSGAIGLATGLAEQNTNLFKSTYEQSTEELHDTADSIAKAAAQENLPPAPPAGGTQQAPGNASVVAAELPKMTRAELEEAVAEERAALEAIPEDQLTPEQVEDLRVLAGPLEEVAAERGVEVVENAKDVEETKQEPTKADENQEQIEEQEQGLQEVAPVAVNETAPDAPQTPSPSQGTPTESLPTDALPEGNGESTATSSVELSDKWKAQGVTLDLSEATGSVNEVGSIPGSIVIDRLKVPVAQQRKGLGSQVLADVKNLADSQNRPVEVLPVALGQQTVAELEGFYAKNGFVPYERGQGQQRGFRYSPQPTPPTNVQNQPQGTAPPPVQVSPVPTGTPPRADAVETPGTAQGTGTAQAETEAPLTPPSKKPLRPTKEDIKRAAPQLTDEQAEVAALLADLVVPDIDVDLAVEGETAAEGTPPEGPGLYVEPNGQMRLFQGAPLASPQDAAPAVARYLQRSAPVEATGLYLEEQGNDLFAPEDVQTVNRTQQRILNFVRDTIKKFTKPQGKGNKAREKVKLGSVKMTEFLGNVWKMANRRMPGWQNFKDTDSIRERSRIIAHEIVSSIARDGSGVDWYAGKIKDMYERLSRVYPELREEGQDRFIFSTILAITSNGENVFNNMDHAVELYERVRGQGRMPNDADATGLARREAAMFKGFARVQKEIDKLGWEQVDKDFKTDVTYGQMKKKYKVSGSDELMDQNVSNAYVLGAKIGAFWGNLNGNFKHIAMDLWFTRTMARLSGDFKTISPTAVLKLRTAYKILADLDGVPDDVKAEFRHYVDSVPMTEGETNWTSVPEDIRAQIPFAYEWVRKTRNDYAKRKDPESGKGFYNGSYAEKTAKNAHVLLDDANKAPQGAEHRKWMRRVVKAAQKHLKENDIDLSLAEMQAIMWFYEKRLYTKFGGTSSMGEVADFDQAAENTLKKRKSVAFKGDFGPRQEMEQGTLFQDAPKPQGQITFVAEMGQAWVKLMKNANASTFPHELAHFMRRFIIDTNNPAAIAAAERRGITKEEIQNLAKWAGVKNGVWSRAAEEKFARGVERYLRDGKAPTSALQPLFDKLSKWMKDIYKVIQGSSIDIKITPEVKAVFDKLFAGPQKQPAAPSTAKAKKKLPPSPRTTSAKNAETDKELEALGFTPLYAPARKSFPDTWDESQREARKDPNLGKTLVREVLLQPRVLSDVEQGVLVHELALAKLRYGKAERNYFAAAEQNSDAKMSLAKDAIAEARTEISDIVTALKLTGTEAGRALAFRKALMDEDFTVVAMGARFQSEINDGKPLSDKQEKLVASLQKQIAKAQENAAKAEEASREQVRKLEEAELEIQALKLLKKERKAPVRRTVAEIVSDRVQSARDKLAKLGFGRREDTLEQTDTLSQADLPPEALEAFGALAAALRVQGQSDKDIEAELASEYGEVVLENIDAILNAAKQQTTNVAKGARKRSPQELASDIEPDTELSNKMVFNMALGFLKQGLRGDAVLDAVTKLLNDSGMEVTRVQVSDAYTNYGKAKFPSKDELLKMNRELRRVELLKRQIDVVRAGELPAKTGQQRDEATAKIRELQKELQEAKRAAGLRHAYKKNQQKGSLDAIKTRWQNDIEDMDIAIRKNQRIDRTRRSPELDEELTKLKARRDAKRAEYDQHFGINRKQMTDEQRLRSMAKSLDKQIAEEEQMERDGVLTRPKRVSTLVPTDDVRAKRERLKKLVEARKLRRKAAEALNTKKTAAQRASERLTKSVQKSIERFEYFLTNGTFPPKADGTVYSREDFPAELLQLRADLQEAVDFLREDGKAKTPKKDAIIRQLERTVADLQRRIDTKDFSKPTPITEKDPRVLGLRETVKLMRGVLDRMSRVGEVIKSAEEKRDDALEKAAKTRTAKVRARIAAGDFSKPIKVPREVSKRVRDAQFEESQAKQEWNRLFFEKQLAERNTTEKVLDALLMPVDAVRTIKTIGDVSAVHRQGILSSLSHPIHAIRNYKKMWKAGLSERELDAYQRDIENNPYYTVSQRGAKKLFLAKTGPGASLAELEEGFRGRLVDKIPVARNVKNFSERSYNAYLNLMRMEHFAAMANWVTGGNPQALTPEQASQIANYVNISTGRGNLGEHEVAAGLLSLALFSPKFLVSRFQWVTGLLLTAVDAATLFKRHSPELRRVRRAIAIEQGRSLFGMAALYSLYAFGQLMYGAATGDDEEWDDILNWNPLSSKFGRIKSGKTYVDPAGGLLQAINFMARSLTNKTVTGKDELVDLGEGTFGKADYASLLGQFARTKLAPVPGTLLNWKSGSNVIGQKVTTRSALVDLVMPMILNDTYETINSNGLMSGIPLAIMMAHGVGLSTRDDELSLTQEVARLLGDEKADFEKGSSSTRARIDLR